MEQAVERMVEPAKPVQFVIESIKKQIDCKSLAEREAVEGIGQTCRVGGECTCAGYFGQDEKGPVYLCLYDGIK
jgi:hypothetical protein